MILKIYFFFVIYQDFISTFIRCGNNHGRVGVGKGQQKYPLRHAYQLEDKLTEKTKRGRLPQIFSKNLLFVQPQPGKNKQFEKRYSKKDSKYSFFKKLFSIYDFLSAYRREKNEISKSGKGSLHIKNGDEKQDNDCEESSCPYICMEKPKIPSEIQSNQLSTEITKDQKRDVRAKSKTDIYLFYRKNKKCECNIDQQNPDVKLCLVCENFLNFYRNKQPNENNSVVLGNKFSRHSEFKFILEKDYMNEKKLFIEKTIPILQYFMFDCSNTKIMGGIMSVTLEDSIIECEISFLTDNSNQRKDFSNKSENSVHNENSDSAKLLDRLGTQSEEESSNSGREEKGIKINPKNSDEKIRNLLNGTESCETSTEEDEKFYFTFNLNDIYEVIEYSYGNFNFESSDNILKRTGGLKKAYNSLLSKSNSGKSGEDNLKDEINTTNSQPMNEVETTTINDSYCQSIYRNPLKIPENMLTYKMTKSESVEWFLKDKDDTNSHTDAENVTGNFNNIDLDFSKFIENEFRDLCSDVFQSVYRFIDNKFEISEIVEDRNIVGSYTLKFRLIPTNP